MTEQPRNWDREMADIDRAIGKQGNVPPGSVPPPAPAPRGGGLILPPAPRRRSVALTWFWVSLSLALALALALWPYQRSCGLQLIFFLGAAGVTALIGVLATLASWSRPRCWPRPSRSWGSPRRCSTRAKRGSTAMDAPARRA